MNLHMKLVTLAVASFALIGTAAQAQFIKGNEAVKVTAAGTKVETPPAPATVGKACGANANCHAGSWRMVETNAGLVECTEPWARPGSCRSSTYGTQKLSRVWVVKRGGEWMQCQFPDIGSKCAPMFARPPANLPLDAIQ